MYNVENSVEQTTIFTICNGIELCNRKVIHKCLLDSE